MSIGGKYYYERQEWIKNVSNQGRSHSVMSQGSHEKTEVKEDISALLERQQSSRLTRKESIVSRFSSIASITSQASEEYF